MKALKVTEKMLGPEHPDMAIRYYNVGDALLNLGLAVDAVRWLRNALNVDIAAYGPRHVEVAVDLERLADAFRAVGAEEEAAKCAHQAYFIRNSAAE